MKYRLESINRAIQDPTLIRQETNRLARGVMVAISSRRQIGIDVFDKNWDLLVILDTCRVDSLRAVADGYSFLDTINRRLSAGGSTPEWIASTFSTDDKEEIQDTAYIVRNEFAKKVFDGTVPSHNGYNFGLWDVVSPTDFGHLEYVWQHYDGRPWKGEKIENSTPRKVTDRVIKVMREESHDRVIAHYLRPHSPYYAQALREDRDLAPYELSPFEYLKRTGDRETVYDRYMTELKWVLNEVRLLLHNVDAKRVIISADHGEAFGELGGYGHGPGSLHPHVRTVPWVETTAIDHSEHMPKSDDVQRNVAAGGDTNEAVDDALEALGYKM